ncbi:MBL fold metallo-hydrolase [Silvibacterium sp.]|uniref:MBL fold metallo-hydrolase n=1 Tax=Silvibacterium sp. TaxID=1964179 RepID=UPI0039E41227
MGENGGMILETFPVGPLQCNCSIVGDETTREAMVIDPGENIPTILARLAHHGLTLKQIVVTHGHIDHVGGAIKLKRATGAPILMNERDMEQLAFMNEQAAWLGVETPEVGEPDVSAEDGMVVGIANHAAQVIATPGHTQGSICLHFVPEQLLIAGDTLFAGSIGRTDLPGGNTRQILTSIHDRLLTLPGETKVIAGHGGATTIEREAKGNPFLR